MNKNKIVKENRYKKAFEAMTVTEKISIIRNFRVSVPRFDDVLEAMSDCHDSYDGKNMPDHLLIMGHSRFGKTTICEKYKNLYPAIKTDLDNIVPVLYVISPAPATIHELISKMLAALGDPKPDAGSKIGEKERRLVKLLSSQKVELIILDEFQHFLDTPRGVVLVLVANWLKNFMNLSPVSIVMVGLPRSEKVIKENEQLHLRISDRVAIKPFGWSTSDQKAEFRRLLLEIDQCLPFDHLLGLSKGDLPARFFDATDGIMGHLMKLIRKTTLKAIKSGHPTVYVNTLEQVWENTFKTIFENQKNPFRLYEPIDPVKNKFQFYLSKNCRYGEGNRWKPVKRKIPISQLLARR